MAKKKPPEPTPDPNAPPIPPPTREQFWLALRRKVKLFYDIQEMRLATEGRLTPKSAEGPIELHPSDLARLRARLDELAAAEKHALRDVEDHVESVPFYAACIEPERKTRFKGLGPTMCGVILSSFDIHREDTVSKMWAFAGLRPMPARRCCQCSVVCVESGDEIRHPKPSGNKCALAGKPVSLATTYPSGKAQKPISGEKLPYNAWLRAKLCGVLAPILLKCGSPYRKFYDDYKHRKQSAGWGVSDGHRHNAAMRYMIKMLLLDLWTAWRTFEGLEVRPPYAEQYLGKGHHPHDTHKVSASQNSNDALQRDASQPLNESHHSDASQPPDETHAADASRHPDETHLASASPVRGESQYPNASALTKRSPIARNACHSRNALSPILNTRATC